jgi:hypothetical protein
MVAPRAARRPFSRRQKQNGRRLLRRPFEIS